MGLEVRGLRKFFGNKKVLDGVDLSVGRGECVVILGPSGCGKSTLLRLIAGLEVADGGTVSVDGSDITGLPPRLRNVALVFQRYALYGYKTVAENIAYPLRLRKLAKIERDQRVGTLLKELEIETLSSRFPDSLSGGEQQRVALGRALVREPSLLLLDEPLSSLDPVLRESLRVLLERMYRRLQVPALHVTHDQEEALLLGDRIAVLLNGRIEQCGSPTELLSAPHTVEVATFVGRPRINLLEATAARDGDELSMIFNNCYRLKLPRKRWQNISSGQKVICGIRPWAVGIGEAGLAGVVRSRRPSPPFVRLELKLEGAHFERPFVMLVTSGTNVAEGEVVRIQAHGEEVFCFDPVSERNLE